MPIYCNLEKNWLSVQGYNLQVKHAKPKIPVLQYIKTVFICELQMQ